MSFLVGAFSLSRVDIYIGKVKFMGLFTISMIINDDNTIQMCLYLYV